MHLLRTGVPGTLAMLLALAASTSQAVAPIAPSLARVEKRPIPKAEFFDLWRDVALRHCVGAPKRHNLTLAQCQAVVTQRHDACERTSLATAPDVVATQAVSKDLGRVYLQCVTPYYFCKGKEVKSEQEARAHCK